MSDPYTVHIPSALYELIWDRVAQPQQISVEQAVNRILAMQRYPEPPPEMDKLPKHAPMGEKGQ